MLRDIKMHQEAHRQAYGRYSFIKAFHPRKIKTLKSDNPWATPEADAQAWEILGAKPNTDFTSFQYAIGAGGPWGVVDIEGVVAVKAGPAVLDGAGSRDPDGDEFSYRWSQLLGPSVELVDPRSANPSFAACMTGLYQFQLVVNDGRVDSLPTDVWVTVHSQCNLPPVADAGDTEEAFCVSPGPQDPDERVFLDGSGSHNPEGPGGDLKFQWLQIGGLATDLVLAYTAGPYFEPVD